MLFYDRIIFNGKMDISLLSPQYLQFIGDLPSYDDKTADSWQPVEIPDETWTFQLNGQVFDLWTHFWEVQNEGVLS